MTIDAQEFEQHRKRDVVLFESLDVLMRSAYVEPISGERNACERTWSPPLMLRRNLLIEPNCFCRRPGASSRLGSSEGCTKLV